jgi:hypothetical protein
MSTPVWTTNIPLATDSPAYSQGQFLANNQSLAAYFANDHYMFDDATAAYRGKHRVVHLEQQGSVTTATNEVAVYNDTSNRLMFRGSNNAAVKNILAMDAFYQGYMNNTGLHTVNSYNISSITFAGTTATINFTTALNSTNYGIISGNSQNSSTNSVSVGPNLYFSGNTPSSASSVSARFYQSVVTNPVSSAINGPISFYFIIWGS